jgi:hypothetical protein
LRFSGNLAKHQPLLPGCYTSLMPNSKRCFARLKGVDAGQLQALSTRISKISFDINCEYKVIGVDRDFPRLSLDVVHRRPRRVRRYDDAEGKVVQEERNEDRIHEFALDAETQVISTPGGKRDFAILLDLLKRAGAGAAEVVSLQAELAPWAREIVKMYDSAQLGSLVLDSLFIEPRLIGRYSAKTVDNRLDLKFLDENAGKLRSIRLAFFVEGMRRSVEARADGVMAVSSSDMDDLEHFAGEMHRLFLKFAAVEE